MKLGVWKGVEGRMNEEDAWIGKMWIHSWGGQRKGLEGAGNGTKRNRRRFCRSEVSRGVGSWFERGSSGGEKVELWCRRKATFWRSHLRRRRSRKRH
jgi:hypothetical protein